MGGWWVVLICVYITQTGLGAGTSNNIAPCLSSGVQSFRYNPLTHTMTSSVLPSASAPSFDGSPRSAAVKRQGLGWTSRKQGRRR
ncbi:hypothetical protein Naga_101373g2 [Nannochloropsis gaditana]|uniref:Secreted protein n=1 Tax=Nannochloropsis gaditana TaxID=72520 RepID=W7TGU6_9STRA|nr:hypothetical protein Naga_101373g2 [Nannochloropsis gaditana]